MSKTKFLTLHTGIQTAKRIKPNWIAVDSDGHMYAHINKPILNEELGKWLSSGLSWNLAFYRRRDHWKSTLRKIDYEKSKI